MLLFSCNSRNLLSDVAFYTIFCAGFRLKFAYLVFIIYVPGFNSKGTFLTPWRMMELVADLWMHPFFVQTTVDSSEVQQPWIFVPDATEKCS
jgi:hypothetical protein